MKFLQTLLTIYPVGSTLRFGVIMCQSRAWELGLTILAATLWLLFINHRRNQGQNHDNLGN